MCGKEAGLWHYKSLSKSHNKRYKASFEGIGTTSQQSLPDMMSSSISIKSEKSENSTHSGSMTHDLSKLATSSDSLAHSDLLKPASSQESLVNLRVSESKQMAVDNTDQNESFGHDDYHTTHHGGLRTIFSEPRLPQATPPELMKELLLSTAPGSSRSHSRYSDSIFSEVGSECFEKRLEETSEKDLGITFCESYFGNILRFYVVLRLFYLGIIFGIIPRYSFSNIIILYYVSYRHMHLFYVSYLHHLFYVCSFVISIMCRAYVFASSL